MADPAPAPPAAAPRSPSRFTTGCLAAAVVAIAAMVIGVVAVTGLIDRLNPFRDPLTERTVDRSGPPVLQSITDLGRYQAATAYYELVIDTQTTVDPLPSFLAGERTLFVAAGNVDATVDFGALDADAVQVDAERRTAMITLPRPALSDPRIDNDRSYLYSRDRGLVDRVGDLLGDGSSDGEDTRRLYQLAEDRLAEAAASNDELRTRAADNTRDMLTSLLRSLGYTEVTVVFEGEPTASATGG